MSTFSRREGIRQQATGISKWAFLTAIAVLACLPLAGCRNEEKQRASVEFHAKGVRLNIDYLLRQLPRKGQGDYVMKTACDQVSRSLYALPQTVREEAGTRVNERVAAAEKARAFFEQIRPTLESRDVDDAYAKAKMDELSKMIDEVEK